jgi:flagella basal body P-ring formation protein FlgA
MRPASGHRPWRFTALREWVALAVLAICGTARAAGEPSPPLAPHHPTVRIELRNEVHVEGPLVRLGDVAVLETLDLPMLERLMALPLGPSPRTGTAVRLERERLLRWIRARTALHTGQIAWAGPNATVVRVRAELVPGPSIASAAAEALAKAVASGGFRAELGSPEVPRDLTVPAGPVELRARPIARAAVLSRHPTVWVDVRVAGRFVRAVPVSFELTVYAPGLVATAPGAPGDLLEPGSVEVREVAWSGTDVLPVDLPAGGLRLRRSIAQGATLTRAHVEPAPLVRRGSWATLRASHGLVSIERRVEILQDGRPGQTIRVRANGQGDVLARVTGPGQVEVVP